MSLLNAILEKKDIDLEIQKKKITSERLKRLLKSEEDVYIEVRELPAKRLTELMNIQFDKKGNFDLNKSLVAKAMIAVEGTVDPDLKNKELLSKFSCETPKDLAIKLFGMELTKISDAICELSGVITNDDEGEEEEEEIKNS